MTTHYGPHNINQTVWHSIAPRLQESRLNSTQKQIRVALWFPLQRWHYQPVTWHSFLHRWSRSWFCTLLPVPYESGLGQFRDYQLSGSLKKYEMPALQDQSQSDKLCNWLHNVLPHWKVYTYMILADTHGSFSCRIIWHIVTVAAYQLYGQMIGAVMCTNN
jgi:hypothetical protein